MNLGISEKILESQRLKSPKDCSHQSQVTAIVAVDCKATEIENFLSPCRNTTVCCRLQQICSVVCSAVQCAAAFWKTITAVVGSNFTTQSLFNCQNQAGDLSSGLSDNLKSTSWSYPGLDPQQKKKLFCLKMEIE